MAPVKRATLVPMYRIAVIAAAVGLGGCVNVSAPDKPIVINLNINITQEVVYKLDGEAKSLIQNNPGIF
ncbi:YnbE family lipoprotein [Sphingomonas spermidinifaciens]|uniref:YnbE family lipoprotein n=1 Tax=Sphingomonas spermidinifaciens TaxID=1141889 RepID=A0A2A4B3A7_9SPHN|nr:YnbE family lipoprotein [Sphingomonas spermidinifaciens]